MAYEVLLTRRAEKDFNEIIEYLQRRWTETEVKAFHERFDKLLDVLEELAYAFPRSKYGTNLRKAVHSKQTVLYYQIRGDKVYIVYIFHTKKDPGKIV